MAQNDRISGQQGSGNTITAGITAPSLLVTTLTASAVVRFSQVVSDFTTADVAIIDDSHNDITITSVTAYTGQGAVSGRDYNINFSVDDNVSGQFRLGFASNAMVTFNGVSVEISAGFVRITYATNPAPSPPIDVYAYGDFVDQPGDTFDHYRIFVRWDAPTPAPLDYQVRWKKSTDSSYNSWRTTRNIRFGTSITTALLVDLDEALYDVQVRSANGFAVSTPVTVTVSSADVGASIREAAVSAFGVGGLRVTWILSRLPTVPVTYQVRWKKSVDTVYGTWTDTLSSDTNFLISALDLNTAYDVQVRPVRAGSIFGFLRSASGSTLSSVTAGMTRPSLPITSSTFAIAVRFVQVVSGFTTGDVSVTGDDASDLTINSITHLTGGTRGQDYLINFSIATDTVGTAVVDITGNVNVNSQSVPVSVGSQTVRWDVVAPISATFGDGVFDAEAHTITVRCTFERAIEVASFTVSDLQIGYPSFSAISTQPTISQVNSGSTDTEFDIVITPPVNTSGNVSYDIQGEVIENSVSRLVLVDEGSVSFTAGNITPIIEVTSVGNASRTVQVDVTFPSEHPELMDPPPFHILHSSLTAQDFVITPEGVTVDRITYHGHGGIGDSFTLFLSLPEQSSGMVTVRLDGLVVRASPRVTLTATSNEESFTYNTFTPVTAGITLLGVQTNQMFAAVVRFSSVVSDFTTADLEIRNDPDGNITLNSVTAYTGDDARAGQDYLVNMSVSADKTGSFILDFIEMAAVTVNSQSVAVIAGEITVVYDTRDTLTAAFGTGVADAVARTVTVRCTFARAIEVASFTSSDLQIGLPQGVSLVSTAITQVNSGSTDRVFDIVFTLPEDVTGSISYDIQGRVTENSVSRLVQVSEGSTEFTTFPSSISPTIKNHEGTKTGDFSVEVNFLNAAVSGFDSADVSISQSGVTAAVVLLGSGVYRIDFTGLPTDSNGTFSLDLIGSVQVSMSGSRSISFAPVTITYDTRTPISARWDGIEGVKTTQGNAIDLYFATTDAITNFDVSDFTVTYISGDTIAVSGFQFNFIADVGVVGNERQFFMNLFVNEGVSGVVQIAFTGRVSVAGVDKAVSAPTVQFAFNTSATATTPGRAMCVISPAERPIGVLADEPIDDTVWFDLVWDQATRLGTPVTQEFTIADIRIHESTATGVKTPLASALTNVGTFGTYTHYRLAVTPPANSQGSVYIEVIEDVLPDIENLPAYSTPVEYDTRPPQIPPEPIWTIPDGVVSDSTAPFDVDVNFGENIVGLTIGDFIIEGILNHTPMLYKVVGGVESQHSDNTPAALFRLKVRPHARQKGTMSIILLRGSVTAVDDMTAGPESNSQSPPIQYDTVPMPEPEPVRAQVSIGYPERPLGSFAALPFSEPVTYDIEWSEDFEVFDASSHIAVSESGSGPYNPLDAALVNIGTPGTFTLWRFTYTPPADRSGAVVISVLPNVYKENSEAFSPSATFDTTTPEPEPEPEPDPVFPPVIATIGTRLLRPGAIIRIGLDTLITGEVDDNGVSISQNPSWIRLGSGTGVNRTITIAPPANTPYTAEDFVITATGPGGSDTETVYVYVEPEAEDIDLPPTARISLPQRPVGTFVPQPFSEQVFFDVTWSEDFEAFDASSHINIYETGSGPYNPLDALLANIGTAGTFTNFRLSYTPPENTGGSVVVEIPADIFRENAKVSSHSATFDTTTPEPEPEDEVTPDILSVVFPPGIQTEPYDVDVTFDRAVTGVDVNAFELEAPTGTTIESVTRQGQTNTYRLRIVPPPDTPIDLVVINLRGGIVDVAE